MMTVVRGIMLVLLTIVLDFSVNRVFVLPESINFYIIIPTVVLFLRKNPYDCILFILMGLIRDSTHTGFFGIQSLAFFITSLHLYWLAKKISGESPVLIFLLSLLSQIVLNGYLMMFYFMTERIDFLTWHVYRIVLFSIVPSAVMTVFLYYGFKRFNFFTGVKKTTSIYGKPKN